MSGTAATPVAPRMPDSAKIHITHHLSEVLIPLIALLASFAVGSLLLLALKVDPLVAYQALFEGAFGNTALITATLVKSIPLMFAGLAVTLAYRGGVFNIGAEGQLTMGALFAVWSGTTLHLPGVLNLMAALALGMVGGMLWGAIPGYLKASRGFNEVIVTILMNYIAIWFVSFLIHGPLKEPGWNTQTRMVDESARLPIIIPGTNLHLGFLLALMAGVIVYILINYTALGLRIRMVGANPVAAEYAGIRVTRLVVLLMMMSGALAGLTGATEILGTRYRLLDDFSPGYGFDAIAVALVGRLNPIGTLLAAIFFGALRNGANSLQTAVNVPVVVVYVLQGLAVLFMIAGSSGNWVRLRTKK